MHPAQDSGGLSASLWPLNRTGHRTACCWADTRSFVWSLPDSWIRNTEIKGKREKKSQWHGAALPAPFSQEKTSPGQPVQMRSHQVTQLGHLCRGDGDKLPRLLRLLVKLVYRWNRLWLFIIYPVWDAQLVLLKPNSKIFFAYVSLWSREGNISQAKLCLFSQSRAGAMSGAGGAFARLKGLLRTGPAWSFCRTP